MRERRKMQLRERHVCEEGFARRGLAADEIDRPAHELGVDAAPRLQVVRLDLARTLAATSFHDFRKRHHGRVEARRLREHRLVGGAGYAVPLVEAAVGWITALVV